MFEIEKGVKMGRGNPGGGEAKYPWSEMGHGDSILVPWSEITTQPRPVNFRHVLMNRVATTGRKWLRKNRPGWKARCQTEDDGIRIGFYDPSQGDPFQEGA